MYNGTERGDKKSNMEFALITRMPANRKCKTFPEAWAARGRQGVVLEVGAASGLWIGNFEPGVVGVSGAWKSTRDVGYVVARGDLWRVGIEEAVAVRWMGGVTRIDKVPGSEDRIVEINGIEYARVAARGVVWRSERVSWDGATQVIIDGGVIKGMGWSVPRQDWVSFVIDVDSGDTQGGGYL